MGSLPVTDPGCTTDVHNTALFLLLPQIVTCSALCGQHSVCADDHSDLHPTIGPACPWWGRLTHRWYHGLDWDGRGELNFDVTFTWRP